MPRKSLIDLLQRFIRHISIVFYSICNRKRFGAYGKDVVVIKPLQIDGYENIYLGDGVQVLEGVWLAAVPLTGEKTTTLVIQAGTSIGHYNHIYATSSITIENNVLTADKVYISDNLHSYEDISIPIIQQPIKQCKPVVIGEGSWIGEHACIIGASIGKHCVIGSNAVVTNDIPDYSVAVGVPARVIKRYNPTNNSWESV